MHEKYYFLNFLIKLNIGKIRTKWEFKNCIKNHSFDENPNKSSEIQYFLFHSIFLELPETFE